MQKISAKLLRTEKLTSDVWEFEFGMDFGMDEKSAGTAKFEPGQFMILDVDDGKEPHVNRSYSLAGGKDDNILFCIKLIPNGRGSEYLRRLMPGDTVILQGPHGHFTLSSAAPEKDLIFVATGVGIAPFMGMLKQMFADPASHLQRKVFLHFGVRYEEDIFYKKQLEAWKAAYPNFDFILTLSKPGEDWAGAKGRVTDHLAKQFAGLDAANTEIFICGSGVMVKEVKSMAEEAGFERPAIHFELFTPVTAK